MIIENRTKRSSKRGNSNKYKPKVEQIEWNLSIPVLDLICSFIVSENRTIRRGHLVNLKNLIKLVDMDKGYSDNPEKMERIEFIQRGIDSRLNKNLHSSDIILADITGGFAGVGYKNVISSIKEVTTDDIQWINDTVASTLNGAFIYNDIDKVIDICEKIKSAEGQEKLKALQEYEELNQAIQTKFRQNKSRTSTDIMFSLRNGIFEDSVRDIHEQLSNPSNRLVTGMQGFNEMTAGGLECGRVYMFFGLPGEGKSTTLLNLAFQIKNNNRNFKPKDPSKTPCVVLLTMENTVKETVPRVFNMTVSDDDMTNYQSDQVINLMRTEGGLYLNNQSPIDVVIKYMPGDSVDTSYLYDLVDDLEDDGYEVIAFIQDYIKRIRSVYNASGDLRVELGAIVNEFKVFASIKDIPVITASQLNRDATKHIDEARKATKADLVRLLGRSNIGESMLMLENIDAGFMIAPEYDFDTNQKYLGIQMIKNRFKSTGRQHIYQPYAEGNGIKLVEDSCMAEPLFRETLRPTIDSNINHRPMNPTISNTGGIIKNSPYQVNEIRDLGNAKLLSDSASNVFNSPNVVNIATMGTNSPLVASFNKIAEELEAKNKPLIQPIIKCG